MLRDWKWPDGTWLNVSGSEPIVHVTQKSPSRINKTVRIHFWAHFSQMLTLVNYFLPKQKTHPNLVQTPLKTMSPIFVDHKYHTKATGRGKTSKTHWNHKTAIRVIAIVKYCHIKRGRRFFSPQLHPSVCFYLNQLEFTKLNEVCFPFPFFKVYIRFNSENGV